MTYRRSIFKKKIELILMWPFVFLGRIAGTLFPLRTKHHIFLFFPSADIGGSVKVNADILECIKDQKPIIIFSKKPRNNQFRPLFEKEGVRMIDLHKYIDKKLFHFVNFFFRGILSAWINKVDHPVVFGGEGLFFYKILPHLKRETKTVELCHLNTWIDYTQAFIKYIDIRIFSTPKIKRDVEDQYKKNNVSQQYFDRLYFVDNKIDIPVYKESRNDILQVLFVGRSAPQKRVHLIVEIAKRVHEQNLPVHFSFVGDVEEIIPPEVQNYCTLYGQIKDQKKLDLIYNRSDVLLLTSAYEGLPIVVMDMMARGKVVISTAVDGIPDYISNEVNGLLIHETDEELVIQKGIVLLNRLISDITLFKVISKNSYKFAVEHFSGKLFCSFYRGVFNK